ncbi:MAG: DNRLRE domain-containing protein [Chloroflexota bacterium]
MSRSRLFGIAPLALALVLIALLTVVGAASGLAGGLNFASQPLTVYRTCTITATPATSTAVIDASVRQGSATSNFGTATTNNVATGSGANRRLYIRFDLSTCSPVIPTTATVRLATLRLYVTARPSTCRTIDLFRVTSTWTESGLTWNNQPFGTAINNPASGSAADTFGIGTPGGCENRSTGTYTVGVNPTADVAAFVAGTATNFGWMLRDDIEGSATTVTETFSAKNRNTVAQAPQLIVTYVTVP